MQYSCAIREFKTKLEVLNDELSMRNARNPIEMIKARVKKPKSIVEKLQRRGLPLSIESMESNLDDIAGVRVICSFVDDIYEISRMLERQDDVTIIAIKDYIKAPKENGYRSYHMIVEVVRKISVWRSRSAPSPWISGRVWITSSSIKSSWMPRKPQRSVRS